MVGVVSFYKRHFLGVELMISLLFGLVFLYFCMTTQVLTDMITKSRNDLFPLLAGAAAGFLGFLITGVSILMFFLNEKKLEELKDSPHVKTIFQIYFSAIKALSILVLIAFIGIFSTPVDWLIYGTCGTFLLVSIARIIRCVWIVEELAKQLYFKS